MAEHVLGRGQTYTIVWDSDKGYSVVWDDGSVTVIGHVPTISSTSSSVIMAGEVGTFTVPIVKPEADLDIGGGIEPMANYENYKNVDVKEVDYAGHIDHVVDMNKAPMFSENQSNDMIDRAADAFAEVIKEALKNAKDDYPTEEGEPWMRFSNSNEADLTARLFRDYRELNSEANNGNRSDANHKAMITRTAVGAFMMWYWWEERQALKAAKAAASTSKK